MGRLEGKIAVVTGGCSGIGLGIVDRYAETGAKVYAIDRERKDEELPGGTVFHQLDVKDAAGWVELVERITATDGAIDVLVNNAGVSGMETVVELDEAGWDRVIDINQKGTWLGMRAVIPTMVAAGGGAIVNMSSICGMAAVPGGLAYHASKGAVGMMTKNAAVTYAPDNVRVNSIAPGFILTPLTGSQDPAINQAFIDNTPIGHAGEPVDIANAALFLGCEESRFVTGVELPVDGGYLAR